MPRATAALPVAVALAALLSTGGSVAKPARLGAARPASLCANDERVVYTCRFGVKLGSVCLARNSLHYRFGPHGRPELHIASTPDWSNIHTGGNRSQGGLNQDYIRFTNGMTHYVVYVDETGSLNENPGRQSSGIEVLQGSSGENALASLTCRSPASFDGSAYDDLAKAAPKDWDGAETPGGPFEVIY